MMEQSSVAFRSTQPATRPSGAEKKSFPLASDLPMISRICDYLVEPVRPSVFAEIELVILTFCTGIQDAISFPDYHCFASNQTGNTVFLMLAIVVPEFDGELFNTANIGAALGFFVAAGWLTGQAGHLVGPRRRWWLVLCNLLQTCMVFVVAALQHMYGTGTGDAAITLVSLSLLAFASGSQVVQSRSLAMPEISTAMATAAWVDLMSDPHMFAPRNRPRNRRVSFLAALVLGALAGAGIYKTAGSAAALLVSACGKLLVTAMYLFNPGERRRPVADDDCETGSTCSTAPQTREGSVREEQQEQGEGRTRP